MKLKHTTLILSLVFILSNVYAQKTDYKSSKYRFKKSYQVVPDKYQDKWEANVHNLQPPFEANKTYKYFLQKRKQEIEKRFKQKENYNYSYAAKSDDDSLLIEESFEGNSNSGIPNDNTMAISNDGIIVSAINTNIIFYDTKNDTLLKKVALKVFSDTIDTVSTHQYDPKVIYDYQQDRFIIVYLAGSSANSKSNILVGFSSTNNPMDLWHFYALPGDAVNDTSWTDYPAISLSDDELYITGNLLEYGGSWQTSFRQSVIWQIDKYAGFNGEELDAKLYYDIKFDDEYIRNIHPVRGGSKFYGPEMYFLSNKNFTYQSDSIFLIKTSNKINENSELSVNYLKSDVLYGAPPNAKMPNGQNLATNDARVLGAYYQNDHIQFVANTLDTITGNAAIYHGFIYAPETAVNVKGKILSTSNMEFGYPNISYVGTNELSKHAIITFDYTGDTIFPGFASIFVAEEEEYSNIKIIKEGESNINRLMGNLERWGDYSGTQPVYNEEGKIWACGTFGRNLNNYGVYGTWIAKLSKTKEDDPVLPGNKDIDLSVFPNPSANEYVNIEFLLDESQNVEAYLLDANGKLIDIIYTGEVEVGKNVLNFNTSSLNNGMYFLVLRNNKKILSKNKIIVTN